MYKRLTLCVGALTLLLHSATVFADDAPQVFVCTSAEYAATGAAAMMPPTSFTTQRQPGQRSKPTPTAGRT